VKIFVYAEKDSLASDIERMMSIPVGIAAPDTGKLDEISEALHQAIAEAMGGVSSKFESSPDM